jgi:hypothetical protein
LHVKIGLPQIFERLTRVIWRPVRDRDNVLLNMVNSLVARVYRPYFDTINVEEPITARLVLDLHRGTCCQCAVWADTSDRCQREFCALQIKSQSNADTSVSGGSALTRVTETYPSALMSASFKVQNVANNLMRSRSSTPARICCHSWTVKQLFIKSKYSTTNLALAPTLLPNLVTHLTCAAVLRSWRPHRRARASQLRARRAGGDATRWNWSYSAIFGSDQLRTLPYMVIRVWSVFCALWSVQCSLNCTAHVAVHERACASITALPMIISRRYCPCLSMSSCLLWGE